MLFYFLIEEYLICVNCSGFYYPIFSHLFRSFHEGKGKGKGKCGEERTILYESIDIRSWHTIIQTTPHWSKLKIQPAIIQLSRCPSVPPLTGTRSSTRAREEMSKIFLTNFCAHDRPCLIANEARTVMAKESLVMLCLFWSGWNAPRHSNGRWGTIPLASAVASQTKQTLSKVVPMLIYPLLIHCLIERQDQLPIVLRVLRWFLPYAGPERA
jgi:hypothetical protein